MESKFIHNKCGGNLFLDLSGLLCLKTPSLSISPEGITVGVSEIQYNKKAQPSFSCDKCGKSVACTNSEEIMVECSLCGNFVESPNISNCFQIPACCESCKNQLSGKEKPSDKIARIAEYLVLPKGLNFIPYSELLKKRFNI